MKTITIPIEDYIDLRHRSNQLMHLSAAGVDNWEGYEEAMTAASDAWIDIREEIAAERKP